MTPERLYNELYKLRAKLKIKYARNGRAPLVCTDEALRELARLAPKRREDIKAVQGLGDTFVEKYGDDFFEILSRYHEQETQKVVLTGDVRETLKKLEGRLVNISRRNRLLYTNKLYGKYALDLFVSEDSSNDILKFLNGKSRELKIAENGEGENGKRFRAALELMREVGREGRESGRYDLYIGYPFAAGKADGDFAVRAPLLLFPAEMVRDGEKMFLKADQNKDVLYNSNFILLHNKLKNLSEEIPSSSADEQDNGVLIKNAPGYYAGCGIKITGNAGSVIKFSEFSDKDFGKTPPGTYRIVNNAVVGKFSLYSGELQRDFNEIAEGNKINGLINALIKSSDVDDIYAESAYFEGDKPGGIDEKNISYINDLNYSQESAVAAASSQDELVIQGPPGTGKSQTITSIIADCAEKGKNVLMVSQKKAALEVIYSRLGKESEYSLFISDVKNKEVFYSQLSKMLDINLGETGTEAFNKTSGDIEVLLLKLDKIADKLFTQEQFGVRMYKIYQENTANQFITGDDSALLPLVDRGLTAVNYPRLKEIYKEFENPSFIGSVLSRLATVQAYPWIKNIRELDQFEYGEFDKMAADFVLSQTEYNGENIFKKFVKRGGQRRTLKKLFKKYFISKEGMEQIFKNPSALKDGLYFYQNYLSDSAVYSALKDDEKKYAHSLFKIKEAFNADFKQSNKKLYDFTVKYFIKEFEKQNLSLLHDIDNFPVIVNIITGKIAEKKELSKSVLNTVLKKACEEYIKSSKRFSEMRRIIESKRRWSIQRFVDKFQPELFGGVRIWLLTPEVVSEILPLESGLFDLLIFDEASQLYVEKGVPAMARAKKVVIAGDHKQLRPSSLGFGRIDTDYGENGEIGENDAALEEESLLDLARFKFPPVLLDCHYRSKYEELIAFSNYAFYGGKLKVSPNAEKPKNPPIKVFKVDGIWEDRRNRAEAKKVLELLKDVIKNRKNKETVGIITFNSSQRDLILDLADEQCFSDAEFSSLFRAENVRTENGEDIGLFIKNIENVQGDERDIIIFSTAYAKTAGGRMIRNFGWLNQQGGENRLNVGISRAKKQIYIVTSINPSDLSSEGLESDGPKYLRKYLDYAFAISGGDTSAAENILLSLSDIKKDTSKLTAFEKEIYGALTANGYTVDTQVGIGGYKIALAIRDKKTDSYALGIECDSGLYEDGSDSRERDIHRRKYLEERGWKIYRIWSTNWWHNSKKEMEKIKSIVRPPRI